LSINNIIWQVTESESNIDLQVQHMKNIKRLTNEKALLAKSFREYKDNSASLKRDLDENISRYQQLQKSFDDLAAELGEDEEHVRIRFQDRVSIYVH